MKIVTLLTATTLAFPMATMAQNEVKNDSINDTKEVKNRNVMLNASSDNQPRQLSIGLPSTLSATIYEDGMRTARKHGTDVARRKRSEERSRQLRRSVEHTPWQQEV